MKRGLILSLLLISFFDISAQTWTGAGDGVNWSDADNWDPKSVPCTTCDVSIKDYPNKVILNFSTTIKSLYLENCNLDVVAPCLLIVDNSSSHGISLFNAATLLIDDGQIEITNTTQDGVYVNSGAVNIEGIGLMDINTTGAKGVNLSSAGVLDLELNSSKLNIENTVAHALYNDGNIANNGAITIDASSLDAITNNGFFYNQYYLDIEANPTASGIFNSVTATFQCISSSEIIINGADEGILSAGTLILDGDIDIDNCDGYGISGSSAMSLGSNGVLTLDQTKGGMSLTGTNGIFTNSGIISITTFPSSIYDGIAIGNDSEFQNYGSITVNSSAGPCLNVGPQPAEFEQSSSGSFICDGGYFKNDGKITLGGTSIIRTLPLTGPKGLYGISHSAVANSDFYLTGDLTIQNFERGINNFWGDFETGLNSSLLIDNVESGIYNTDKFFTTGSITIQNIEDRGIFSDGNFRTFSTASISVDTILNNYFPSVHLRGDIINQGVIEITDNTSQALLHENGVFENSGDLILAGTGTQLDELENKFGGTIDANSMTVLRNTVNLGSIEMAGSFMADSLLNSGFFSVKNGGIAGVVIENYPTAVLNVAKTNAPSIINPGDGIALNAPFLNQGEVYVTNAPLDAIKYVHSDTLINEGKIYIDHCVRGIKVEGSGSIANRLSGEIKVDNASSAAIQIEHSFKNDGLIEIDNSIAGIRRQGTAYVSVVNNYGTILTDNTTRSFDQLLEFNNYSTGVVSLTNGSYAAVSDFVNFGSFAGTNGTNALLVGSFENHGEIDISNLSPTTSPSSGFGIRCGTFNNYEFGSINITNARDGIFAQNLVGTPNFFNFGEIDITNVENGIGCQVGENQGVIKIDTAAVNGILGLTNASGGELYIYNTINNNILENEACGYIETDGGYSIKTNNYGYILTNETNPDNIRVDNHAILSNLSGIRVSHNKSVASGFRNFGLQAGVINGTPSDGINELNVVRIEPPYNHGASIIYTDAANTIQGGVINAANNAVIPNAAGVNADTLYFPVNYGPSCNTNLKIPVHQSGPCSSITSTMSQGNTLPGIPQNRDWHLPENWPNGEVPGPCTNVNVDRWLIVPPGSKARAHAIDTSTSPNNAPLLINSGAVVEVDPSL